jgi:DNA gyrase subunit A
MMTLPVKDFDENKFLVMGTKQGIVKKTALSEYRNIRVNGINAISIEEGDELICAKISDGNQEILMTSAAGISIRFNEKDVRPMGRTAYGVYGMSLEDGDAVVGMDIISPDQPADILVVSELGYGKRTPLNEYRSQTRGGKGILTMKCTDKTGNLVSARLVSTKEDLMLISSRGKLIRILIGDIRETGRNAQGVRLMSVEAGEKVVAVENIPESDTSQNGETTH